MPVTIREVAHEAGVSAATVSRILTGHRAEVFPEATRRRIEEAARRMGYRPNLAARSLQTQRSFLIGVLINASNSTIATDFLRGVQIVLATGDYSPVVFSHADCAEQDQCLRRCADRRVDGLIINAMHDTQGSFDMAHFESLLPAELPVIEVFGRFLAGVPSINIDNEATGRMATRHLLDLGHRRIAMLTHDRYLLGKGKRAAAHFDAWDRYCGYETAMQSAGLEPLVVTHPISGEIDVTEQFVEGGRTALDLLLAHADRPTAVVCYNDFETYGLVRRARELGFFLPERLSAVGFGDMDHSRIMAPALTTIPVPAFEVGRRAAQALLDRIEDRRVESALIESELAVRESTARCEERTKDEG
jgi:DNA-binding LacI/PurR family transcriptional regulator